MEKEPRDRTPERRRSSELRESEADAWFLIQAGIDWAMDYRRDIDDMTARIIAFNIGPGITSNLAFFAQTGGRGPHADNKALRAEYLPIYHDADTPDDIRELIDWLGAYLVHREKPVPHPYAQPEGPPKLRNLLWHTTIQRDGVAIDVHVRADQPAEVIDALPGSLAPLLDNHSDAMTAFLSLPDVDATSPDLEESFTTLYRGSFDSRDDAIAGLIEVEEIETAIRTIADNYAGGEYVSLDRDALWHRLHDVYEIVTLDGQHHAFDK